MANIREYQNQVGGFEVSGRPAALRAQAAEGEVEVARAWGSAIGGAVQGFGQVAEEYRKNRVVRDEVGQGSALEAKMIDSLSRGWNEAARTTDVNDTNLGDRWRQESLEPALEQFQSLFTTPEGQAWAQQRADAIRDTFYTRTRADGAVRAGEAASQNFRTLVGTAATSSNADPSLLDHNLGLIRSSVDTYVNAADNLSVQDATALRTSMTDQAEQEVITAAFMGMAKANPEAFLASIQAGQFNDYLAKFPDGTARDKFIALGEQEIKFRQQQENAAAVEQRRIQDDAINQASAALIASQITPSGEFLVTPDGLARAREIALMPGAKASDASGLINALDSIAKAQAEGKVIQTDPATYNNFIERMFLPDTDPNRLTPQELHLSVNKLSAKDFAYFSDAISNKIKDPQYVEDQRQFDDVAKSFKGLIAKTNFSMTDGAGEVRYQEMYREKQTQFLKGRAAGLTPSQMLDRNSPYYLFSDIAKWQLSADFVANPWGTDGSLTPRVPPPVPGTLSGQGAAPIAAPVVEKRLPGETYTQYKARTAKAPAKVPGSADILPSGLTPAPAPAPVDDLIQGTR